LSKLRQISTDIFWWKDGKWAKIMPVPLISHLTNSCHITTVLNADVPNCYTTLKVDICINWHFRKLRFRVLCNEVWRNCCEVMWPVYSDPLICAAQKFSYLRLLPAASFKICFL